jgi:hypothetical protein
MKRVTFTVVVDPDVNYPLPKFREEVQMYLADPYGWESKGYDFELVERNPDVVIHLSSPSGLRKIGCDPNLNCAEMGTGNHWGNNLHVNALLWTRGAPKSKLELEDYRQYVISHEIGHILGHDHVKCPGIGHRAPVMLQQTLGLHGCSPNTNVS